MSLTKSLTRSLENQVSVEEYGRGRAKIYIASLPVLDPDSYQLKTEVRARGRTPEQAEAQLRKTLLHVASAVA